MHQCLASECYPFPHSSRTKTCYERHKLMKTIGDSVESMSYKRDSVLDTTDTQMSSHIVK